MRACSYQVHVLVRCVAANVPQAVAGKKVETRRESDMLEERLLAEERKRKREQEEEYKQELVKKAKQLLTDSDYKVACP